MLIFIYNKSRRSARFVVDSGIWLGFVKILDKIIGTAIIIAVLLIEVAPRQHKRLMTMKEFWEVKEKMSEIQMTDKRMGEIAVAVEKYRMRRDGIFFKNENKRDIGNLAKDTGIPLSEVMEFFEITIACPR